MTLTNLVCRLSERMEPFATSMWKIVILIYIYYVYINLYLHIVYLAIHIISLRFTFSVLFTSLLFDNSQYIGGDLMV